jgi:signal transduction histidine kinase
MSDELIKIFNDYYKQYLDNTSVNLDYLYDSFINQYFIEIICNKTYEYKLNLYCKKTNYRENYRENYKIKKNQKNQTDNDSSGVISERQLKDNKYNLVFNNNHVGYLIINTTIINNITEFYNTIDLFLQYLSILIYNTSNNEINNIKLVSKQCIFNDILDMMTDGIIVCDNKFNIYMINNVAKNMITILNIYTFEYINKKIFDIFSQLEDILELNEIYKNKKIYYKIDKNNIKINLLLTINTIIYDEQLYYIILINNQNNVDKINNDGFLGHELRNQLQTITFANHLIQKKSPNIDNNIKKYLNIIDKSVYDMIKIINDILDIDRLESNKLDLKFENIDINELIEIIKFDFSKYLTNSNISFDIICDKSLAYINYSFFTDITRIKQILLNILSNSVKYSKSNILNTIILSICYDDINKYINFSIKDTGIGIKSENINNILNDERSYIITNSINNSNGIGLYICNKIAQLLGGIIKINSKYNEGSEFIFSHPIKFNNIQIIQKNLEKINICAKILLVDDNENMILLFKDIIDNIKFNYNISHIFIDILSSNDLLYDMARTNNYDIIFIDINMVNISGISVIKLLRRNEFNNKIIVLSNDINTRIDNTLYDGILIKPFSENDIFEKLKMI